MSAVITSSAITTLHTGTESEVRTVEVVTDGRVGAPADAVSRARILFEGDAHLSFRKSDTGELRFYFTDRPVI